MSENEARLHAGHRARMREKLLRYGRDVFYTHELLEMLLFYAVPYKDTNPIAKKLISRFDTLDGVLSATSEELTGIYGVGIKIADMLISVGKINLESNDIDFEDLLSCKTKEYKEAADKLISRYGSPRTIFEAGIHSVCKTLGGDMSTAFYINLAVALASRRKCDLFELGKRHTDREIKEYLIAKLFGLCVETIYILSIDGKERVVSCERIGEGTFNNSEVLPQRLIEIAKKDGANGVIIAHNHPGTTAAPSDNDIAATLALSRLLQSNGIRLNTHYVLAGAECREVIINQ